MPLTAPLDQTKPPPFWEMEEYRFQEFCLAVWRSENADCHIYGVRGQKQHGIDLRTYGQPPGAGSVGQCKCYKEFTTANMRSAVKEFTDHLAVWRRQKIMVYRLYVASSCANTAVQKEYAKQKQLLSRKGITFELHDSHGLVTSLRNEPTIVSRFCGDHWVQPVCGANALGLARQAVMAAVISLTENGAIFIEWESDRDRELEALRERIRCGHGEAVYQECLRLVTSTGWGRFTPRLRSKVFRILSNIDCNTGNFQEGAQRLKLAKEEDPSADYQVIDALYEANTVSIAAGVAKLGDPTSIDAWNFQLSLWLMEGKLERVVQAFETCPFPLNAESFRLKATALLLTNQVEAAVEAADHSVHMAPDWTANRFTAAMVNYQSVISPLFHAWRHQAWPVPPDWQYVRQDQVAQQRLEKAVDLFKGLLAQGFPSEEGMLNLETWLLAAYACHPHKRQEALKLVEKFLKEKPDHFRVAMWAVERGFPFDQEKMRQALQILVSRGNPSLPAIIQLVNLTGLRGDVPETKRLLEVHRDQFNALGAEDEWRNLMVQVLAQDQSWDEARALLAEDTGEGRWSLQAALAHIRFKQNNSIKELADELGLIYEQSKSPAELIPAAEAKLHANEPGWFLSYRDEALRHFPHLRTLQLLMVSAFRLGQFAQVLELLEQNQTLIPTQGLPDEIIRLKGRCLKLLGRLADAFASLRELTLGDGHLDNTLELFELQIAMVDGPGAVTTAQLFLTISEARPLDLLNVCRSICPFSVPMASRLWKKVIGMPNLSDQEILIVVDLGFKLGLDQFAGPFVQQLQRIHASGSGLVQMVSIDELIQLQRDHVQALGQANRDYNRGFIPVHVTSEALQCSLGFLYHVLPKKNAATNAPLLSAPLLIRSGAHGRDVLPDLQGKNVVVDITSLLLARHLGILPLVEDYLGSLSISAWIPTSLHRQIQQIASQQPALDKPRHQVHQAWLHGRIKPMPVALPGVLPDNERLKQMGAEWYSQFSELQKEGGLLVTYFPVTAQIGERHILVLSADELKTIVPLGSFLLGLQGAGVLSASDLAECHKVFGIEAQFVGDALQVARHQVVLLDGVIAERLASAGVLDKIAQYCQLRFNQFTAQLLENQEEALDSREELANWLREFSEHVSERVQNGAYKTFSQPQTEAEVMEFTQHPELGCFHDLIPSQALPERLTWCDDRLVTAHQATDAGPVFGIVEMLGILRKEGKLTKEEYFSKLHELRRSNVRFLPVTPEEIVFLLQGTTIASNKVSETAELSALRMSLAAALADTSRLQLPGEDAKPNAPVGDLPWIIDANRASFEALQLIWKDEEPDVAVAKSEWIIGSLVFDLGALRDMHRPALGEYDASQFYFLNLQEWMLVAFRQRTQFLTDRNADSRRRLFFRWMYERLIIPVLAANPDAETALGNAVGLALEQVIKVGKEVGLNERQSALTALGLLMDLPLPLQDLVKIPDLLRKEFAVEKGQIVLKLGGIEFAYADFWKAMADAVNGRPCPLAGLEGAECQFLPGDTSAFGHEVILERPGLPPLVSTNENNPILNDDPTKRLQFIQGLPHFADYPEDKRASLINEIVSIPESLPRLERLTRELELCPAFYYQRLADNLQLEAEFPPDRLFPTDPEILPRFLHVSPQGTIEWDLLAQDLLQSLPLKQAILRLSCLPKILPACVVERVLTMSDTDFAGLHEELEQEAFSPIRRLHLFHLVAARAKLNDRWHAKAIDLLSQLASSATEPSFEAFKQILSACFRRLEQYAAVQPWSPTAFMSAAWCHAVQLHDFQVKNGVPQDVIAARFENELRKCSARLIPQCEEAYADASSPRNLYWGSFLCRAVGEVLAQLPEDVRASIRPSSLKIQGALSEEKEEAIVFAELACETETRTNHLAGFLGGPWLPPLRVLFPSMDGWLINDPHAYALLRLGEIEADPYNVGAWSELWFLFRGALVHESPRERVEKLLETVNFARLFEVKGEEAQYVLGFCCSQAGQSGNPALAARMMDELSKISVFCQQQRDKRLSVGADDVIYERVLWVLIQAVQFLSIKRASADNPSPFCSSMNRLIQLCPSLGSSLRRRLGGEPPALAFKLNRGIWPFYMRLRAVP